MMMKDRAISRDYLLKQLPKATAFLNTRLEVMYASDLWLNMFEFPKDYRSGTSINHLFINMIDDGKKALENSLQGISVKPSVHEYNNATGEKKWFEWISFPWYDENENIIGVIINSEDITKRILNELRLTKLEILLDEKSEIANIGTWEYNLITDEIKWDDRAKVIHEVPTSYDPTTSEANDFYKNGHSRNTISMAFNKAIKEEIPWREKLQLVTAKGNVIWVINSGKPIYTNGDFTGLIGTIQNINELTLKEIKTKENQHLLRTLIDNLPLNVYIKDLESRKILVNKSEMEYCEANTEAEILGVDDFAIFNKKTAEGSRKDDLIVMRDLKPILSREMLHEKKDGSTTTFLTSKIPLIDTDGHAYGLVGISLDISDRKKKETELRKLIDVTSSQNQKLINFAHIVSHNLRSHSANFSMLLDLLNTESKKSEREKIMKMLLDSSDNLLETLDNLNEVVVINTNTNLRKKSISINKKIIDIQQNLKQDITQNKVEIINTINDDVKLKVVPEYLDSILTNFITNGIKYRSPDRDSFIKFSSYSIKNHTVISIEDNGIGIDLEKHGKKLFGMYKTFHNNTDSRGIGLYISKNQMEAMNGKITVHSKINKGTIFKIYFNDKN